MLRPLAVVLAVISLLAVCTSAGAEGTALAPGNKVTGHWQGMVRDDTGADQPYQVKVHISRSTDTGELKGRVVYPYCSGYWSFVRTNAGWQVFTEHITKDPAVKSCVPKLKVKVKRTQKGGLYVKWVYHSRTDHMLAHKV
jgi:hypothetical protein